MTGIIALSAVMCPGWRPLSNINFVCKIPGWTECGCVEPHYKEESEERVQKVALKVILKEDYENYAIALGISCLQKLELRRSQLCLWFAKKCLKNEKTVEMFPLNKNFDPKLRNSNRYEVKFASTNRLKDSAIPALQRMLNEDFNSNNKI